MSERQSIFIMLTYTGTIPSKLIKMYTRKTFSHVSISLDRELTELYSFGRKHLKFPLIAGFVHENPQKGLYALYPNTLCRIFEVQITKKQHQRIEREIEKFKRQRDKYRYNFIGLAGLLCNRRIVLKDRYFCSQFVAKVLQSSQVNLFAKAPEYVTVEDFNLHLDEQAMIFEGNLQEYIKFSE